MGHETETQTVSYDDAKTGADAVSFAIQTWADERANRFDSQRANRTVVHPLMTYDAAVISLTSRGFDVSDGQAAAIAVCRSTDAVVKTVKMRLTVDRAMLTQLRVSGGAFGFLQLARRHFGPTVINVSLVSMPKAKKAAAVATVGKAVTRYELVYGSGRVSATTYDTQADARAAALTEFTDNPNVSRVAVRAQVQREDGNTELVVVQRPEAESVEITVDVTTSAPKAGAVQSAWRVGFDYHR